MTNQNLIYINSEIECSCCGSKYDARNPKYFKERDANNNWKGF